jgi:methylenetetrahydrofolate dehydrogenase (NADP+)/methenyltetrahydrofolate cyclohydrolase
MKFLNGAELAGYIKERQAKQVRNLRQAYGIYPKLAILQTVDDPVIDTYVRLKQRYGDDILIEVETFQDAEDEALGHIRRLNNDASVHGIIVQLPLADASRTDELLNAVAPEKDVDALGTEATLDPATPMAINWLLAGYNIQLEGRRIVIVGNGRLVGAPLARMWRNSGYQVDVLDETTEDIGEILRQADIIVSATGTPRLITSDMVALGATVVDAATASESGKIVGDVAPELYERSDLTITPLKGGVGPLTVSALFDNVIRTCRQRAEAQERVD